MSEPSADLAARAEAVVRKLAHIAENELPYGYTLQLDLHAVGESWSGTTIVVYPPPPEHRDQPPDTTLDSVNRVE